jgi:hypothetical protein
MELAQFGDVMKIVGGIVALLNFVGIIFLFIANKMAFTKIMTNDLKHLDGKLDGVSSKQEQIENKVVSLSEDVCYIKGQYDAMFPVKTTRRRTTRRATKKRTTKKKVKK